jgi:hypothetical protein
LKVATRARDEAEAVGESVRIQTAQLTASDRPYVYPITDHDWLASTGDGGQWLSFRNGGTGIARNVSGRIRWPVEGGEAALIGQTLGAGDHARLRVGEQKRIQNWSGVVGNVVYQDTQGDEWQSRFRYEQADGQVWAELIELGLTRDLGDWS